MICVLCIAGIPSSRQLFIRLIACAGLSVTQVVLHAATITFYFTATVASVDPAGGAIVLPFPVATGDHVDAVFTLEAGSAGPIHPQPGSINIVIAGHTFDVAGYQIKVAHNELIGIDVPGRISDPNNAPEIEGGPNGDTMYVTCAQGGPLYCGVVDGNNGLLFRPNIIVAEPTLLLSSNDLVADPATWNLFSRRELSLTFRNFANGREAYIGANFGEMSVVPEAKSVVTLIITSLTIGGAFVPRREPRSSRRGEFRTIRRSATPSIPHFCAARGKNFFVEIVPRLVL
jgi:hypothetical protein